MHMFQCARGSQRTASAETIFCSPLYVGSWELATEHEHWLSYLEGSWV